MFIDEFDSIGRRGTDAQNEFYHTAVVNCVLEELQGFEDRDGVMVIAATNRPDAVDPALKRAGRLDRTVEIHYPTIDALEHIYRYYIGEQAKLGLEHGTLNLKELARLTFGQTGADVEVYVRGAARRARMRAGTGGSAIIQQEDFVAEIMKSPAGGSGAMRLGEAEMRRTAVHEAGHALIQIAGPTRGANIGYLSITPRADGTLGFVFNAPDARYTRTRGELEEMVRVLLGGRAAEAVVFGEDNVSSGAGGPSPAADLAQATTLLRSMAAHYGFSRRGGLVWRGRAEDRLPDDVDKEVRQVLGRLYRRDAETHSPPPRSSQAHCARAAGAPGHHRRRASKVARPLAAFLFANEEGERAAGFVDGQQRMPARGAKMRHVDPRRGIACRDREQGAGRKRGKSLPRLEHRHGALKPARVKHGAGLPAIA